MAPKFKLQYNSAEIPQLAAEYMATVARDDREMGDVGTRSSSERMLRVIGVGPTQRAAHKQMTSLFSLCKVEAQQGGIVN